MTAKNEWRVYYGATHCQVFPVASERNTQADAISVKFSRDIAGEEAKARLIAAAPDLLEALAMLHDETADYVTINNLGDPHHNRSMQLARAALAKARGATGKGQDTPK